MFVLSQFVHHKAFVCCMNDLLPQWFRFKYANEVWFAVTGFLMMLFGMTMITSVSIACWNIPRFWLLNLAQYWYSILRSEWLRLLCIDMKIWPRSETGCVRYAQWFQVVCYTAEEKMFECIYSKFRSAGLSVTSMDSITCTTFLDHASVLLPSK